MMKTKKFSKKLGLNKELIANLDNESMKKAQGGLWYCNCKVYTCRTCLPGTCTCYVTELPMCPMETELKCPFYPEY